MALVNMTEMLQKAKKEGYAVGSFDLINMEFAEAIIEAAVSVHSPVILSTAAVHFDYVNMKALAPSLVRLAEEAPVPVTLHLDHGSDLEMAILALRLGFTGIQVDTAHLPFAENVAYTKEVVRAAHAVGASVEGELGYVAGHEGDHQNRQMKDETVYTLPSEAEQFAALTGIDCLAVSVGTIHGLLKGEPRIDFDRLNEINQVLDIPLVIHGGSGLADETYRKLVQNGMSKINFYAELSKASVESIKERLQANPETTMITEVLGGVRQAVASKVSQRIQLWGSANQA